MEKQTEVNNAIITFINETKAGRYARIDDEIIETPRITQCRDEYIFENEEMAVFFSMSN